MGPRLSPIGRWTFTALLGAYAAIGCEAIAGYNDVEPRPPSTTGGKAGTAASGAGGGGGQLSDGGSAGTGAGTGASGGRTNSDARPDTTEPDSSGGTTSADVSVEDAPQDVDAGPCRILVGGNACATVPKFTASRQVIDGDGSEFCDIPAMVFDVNDCPTMIP